MSDKSLFLIDEIAGLTPEIGRLVSMMNYVRSTTLKAVKGLSTHELDHVHDARSNSIGALLLHIASAEVGYQAATFHGRVFNEEEKQEWGVAVELGERARREIRGHDLNYYETRLEQVRATTLAELASRNDQWLDERTTFGSGQQVNNYFKWFHVFTHEVNHRGQISWLRSRVVRGESA